MIFIIRGIYVGLVFCYSSIVEREYRLFVLLFFRSEPYHRREVGVGPVAFDFVDSIDFRKIFRFQNIACGGYVPACIGGFIVARRC